MATESPTATFFKHLEEGRFMLQRGKASGKYFYYPRAVEPVTGAVDYEWVEVSGLGTVYSTTTIRQRPPKEDYNLALIDLDEGPRMLSRVENIDPREVAIGMRVKARIAREGETPVILWDPAD